MKSVTTVVLVVLCLATFAYAPEAVVPPVAAAERDTRDQSVDHRTRSPYAKLEDALVTALVRCEAVQRRYDVPVECKVSMYNRHPTMLVSFLDAHAAESYRPMVVDKVAHPFCNALTDGNVDARLVLLVRDAQMASIYACETGKLSEWMSVAAR